ncbi:MAG: hypothetical protein VW864_06060 [Flavobacteriaceae bacterium]
MSVIKEPKKWYVRLFTLGKNFSSQTFSDNFKKFLLNGIGLFIVVTFTFYVENLGDDYERKKRYVEQVKVINAGLDNILEYSKEYKEENTFVGDLFKKQFDLWEIDNDSIFLDFFDDDEDPDGKYYFPPLAYFDQRNPFNPPKIGFDIFESGDQEFKLVDPFITSIISELGEGYSLGYLTENTNDVEEKYVNQFKEVVNKWSIDNLDITQIFENEFWIENRKHIQNDLELKYILYNRMNLWIDTVGPLLDDYIDIIENDKKILDSVIQIYDNEKFFLYWKIN